MDRVLLDTLVTGLPMVPAFLGMYTVLRLRQDFDLSVEGSFALGGAVTGVILTASGVHHPLVAVAAAVAAGAVVGATTAALHLLLRIPVLMAGLVMNIALFSVTLRVLGTPTMSVVGVEHDLLAVLRPTGSISGPRQFDRAGGHRRRRPRRATPCSSRPRSASPCGPAG